jgi:aspartate racemase
VLSAKRKQHKYCLPSARDNRRKKLKEKIIGIAGGVGPYAGVDLLTKIFDNTIAEKDQQHLTVSMISAPSVIEDRTSFLLKKAKTNPGYAIGEILLKLEKTGAEIAGIPCNTAHAPEILETAEKKIKEENGRIKVVNMISEVADYMNSAGLKNAALLCSSGLASIKLYPAFLEAKDIHVIESTPEMQDAVHESIYNLEYGIKAKSNPVTEKARSVLKEIASVYISMGADSVILGCTELPLAFKGEKTFKGAVLIDTTNVLARALVREACAEKLKPEKILK